MEIRKRDGTVLFSCEGDWTDDDGNARSFVWLNLRDAELRGSQFGDASFENADLSGADFYEAFLFRANFSRATCVGTCFRGAHLEEAHFRGADLRHADFTRDDIWRYTRVGGADFTGANLDGALLTNALYDHTTIFPSGFDPGARGMVTSEDLRAQVLSRRPGSDNLFYPPAACGTSPLVRAMRPATALSAAAMRLKASHRPCSSISQEWPHR